MDAISSFTTKVTKKNAYKKYRKDVLEKRKIYYKIEEEKVIEKPKEADLDLEGSEDFNADQSPMQRKSQIKNKMSQEDKIRVEFLKILKNNVDEYT